MQKIFGCLLARASGKMRICWSAFCRLADFQTCKMRMVLRIFLRTWRVKCRCRCNIISWTRTHQEIR